MTAEPFATGDNGIELSKAIFQRALLAREQIVRLVPFFLEKYKDQLAELETQAHKTSASPFDIVPLDLKVLLQSPETIEEEERALDLARQQIKEQRRVRGIRTSCDRSSPPGSVRATGVVATETCNPRLHEFKAYARYGETGLAQRH